MSSKSLSESHSSTSDVDDGGDHDDDGGDEDSNLAEDGTFISLQTSVSRQSFAMRYQRDSEKRQKCHQSDRPVNESVEESEALMYSGTMIESGIKSTASPNRSQSEGERGQEQAREPSQCSSAGRTDSSGLDHSKAYGLVEKDSGVGESLVQDDGNDTAKNSSRNRSALKLFNLDDSNTWSITNSSPCRLPRTSLLQRNTTKKSPKNARRIQPITIQCSCSSGNGIIMPFDHPPSRQVGEKYSNTATSKHLDDTQVLCDLSNMSSMADIEQRGVDRVNHSMTPCMKHELASSNRSPRRVTRVKCGSVVLETIHGLVQPSHQAEVGDQSVPCKGSPQHQAGCLNGGYREKDSNCEQHIKPILCSKMEAFKELKKSLTFPKETSQCSDRKPSGSCSWQAKCKVSK